MKGVEAGTGKYGNQLTLSRSRSTGSALLYFDEKYILTSFSEKIWAHWLFVYGTIGAVFGKFNEVLTIKSLHICIITVIFVLDLGIGVLKRSKTNTGT